MRYKLKNNDLENFLFSVTFHVLLSGIIFLFLWLPTVPKKTFVQMNIVEVSRAVPTAPLPQTIEPKVEKPPEKRQVFGASRKSITTENSNTEVKAGNTLAKTPDNEKLRKDDADSLPIPSEEYLVTQMPSVLNEVKATYPVEAKKNKIQGAVVLQILIDQNGDVRSVEIVNGPGFGLNEAAAEALKKFKFRPALIEKQTVAVKIRYTYRFVLEGS